MFVCLKDVIVVKEFWDFYDRCINFMIKIVNVKLLKWLKLFKRLVLGVKKKFMKK